MKLQDRFYQLRRCSEDICSSLITEDYVVQSMPDASPVKWHLAHTTWFFETFILSKYDWYKPFKEEFRYLFNSYYSQVGERFLRAQRGLLTRPSVSQIYDYRKYVDKMIGKIFEDTLNEEMVYLFELGINHEQQHQELILTDIKHCFSINPLHPVYTEMAPTPAINVSDIRWVAFNKGIYNSGHDGKEFSFDNETPLHKEYIVSFELANRLITNREYLQFISEGGYKKEILWLSDAWVILQRELWEAPLYWLKKENEWYSFTLHGLQKVNPDEPVCHISFYEANAFASWYGARLATEFEWELAAGDISPVGNFLENGFYHPLSHSGGDGLYQLYGDVWEWTRSSYSPYPGYKPLPGALGEYNGKFMSGQYVLKGGSCVTPKSHIRKTYRNFFPPSARWQFMGIRLAKDKNE